MLIDDAKLKKKFLISVSHSCINHVENCATMMHEGRQSPTGVGEGLQEMQCREGGPQQGGSHPNS